MRRLFAYVYKRLSLEELLVLAGDFNVIPEGIDVSNARARAIPSGITRPVLGRRIAASGLTICCSLRRRRRPNG